MSWRKLTVSRARLAATTTAAALALSLAGCSGDEPAGDATEETTPASPTSQAPSPSASPSETESEQPTEQSPSEPATTVESTEEAPSAAPVQPPPEGSSPRQMLLSAPQVPGLNDQHRWKPIGTENGERRQPVWACQVTDFMAIGATDVSVRRFTGQPGAPGSARARSAVITFADETSAKRAYAVLQAWHDRCEDRLEDDYRRVRVDDAATAVEVDGGPAQWRLAIYGPVPDDSDAGFFDATGYVRNGERISLVTMVSVGQDYNYPVGEEPIVGALRAADVKLLG